MPSTQIRLTDLKEDPTKAGEVIFRDESTGELVSEPHLDKKRGGFGEDISNKNGFPKLTNDVWSFEEIQNGSTTFDDLLIDNPTGHVVVANGTPYVEPLEAIREWTPETQYTSGMVFSYKKLLFRYMNATTSSINFSDDLGLIECLSSNARIIYQLNHGFLPLSPLYIETGIKNSSVVSFTTVGNTSWTPPENTVSVDVLIIGGGGGGAHGYSNAAGTTIAGSGGGAGTQRYYTNVSLPFPYVAIPITVGGGGAGGTGTDNSGITAGGTGGNSSFGSLIATGGTGGSRTTDKGGSNADYSGCGVSGGAQGGGAGSGASATTSNGGAGKYCAITGTNIIRGGGGGGGGGISVGSNPTTPNGTGGSGGGGSGTGVSGTANTGSGGGGKYNGTGGSGGSGIVIVKYTISNDIWKLAKANTQETKATHVVIEKSTNFALISNQGTFDFGGHGLTDGVKYVSDTTLGGLSDYDNQMLSNPFLFVSGTDITIMSGLIIRNTDRYIDNFINGYSTAPIGSVIPYAGIVVPDAYLFCDGSEVSKTVYAELYSVIGDRYGSPSLSTNFILPNLLGRVIGGLDSAQTEFDTVGKSGGAKTHTLTTAEIPAHTHNMSTRNSTTVGGSEVARVQTAGTIDPIATATNTGGGGAHNNLQPYLTMNYIIKYRKDELGDNGGSGTNTGDETKATIESKLTGQIDSHTHFGLGQDEESFVLIKRIDKSTAGDEVVTLDGNLYDVIKIYVQSSNSTTTASNLYLTFNGDSGSNYMKQGVYFNGSASTSSLSTITYIVCNYNVGVVGVSNSSELIIFPKVTGTRRPIQISRCYGVSLTDIRVMSDTYTWSNTASNITTFNITGFTAGSKHTITIFGRKAPV